MIQILSIGRCNMSLIGVGLPTTLKLLATSGTFQLPMGHYYPLLENLKVCGGPSSLRSLSIELFPKLKVLGMHSCENLESLSTLEGSLQDLTSLTSLVIEECPNFVSFPEGGLCAPNLTKIEFWECEKLKSLPKGMHTLLPSLMTLKLFNCPELDSFPEGGLPSNLQELMIKYCEKLFPHHMEWGLQGLQSLRVFSIGFVRDEVDYFPKEALLPPNLIKFFISHFPHLKSFNGKGFQHLTSLKQLCIWHWDMLQCLPEEGLPASLSSLQIEGCPLMKQRCQRENREDWPKIVHIPS